MMTSFATTIQTTIKRRGEIAYQEEYGGHSEGPHDIECDVTIVHTVLIHGHGILHIIVYVILKC